MHLNSLALIAKHPCLFFWNSKGSSSANRLRLLKSLPTKSAPVYSLRVRNFSFIQHDFWSENFYPQFCSPAGNVWAGDWSPLITISVATVVAIIGSPLIFVSQFVHSCALLSHYCILLHIFFSEMLSYCSSDSVPRMKFQGCQILVSELQDFCRIWRLCYQKSFPSLPMMQFSIV